MATRTHTAKIEGVTVKDLRTVTLAHPLNERDMQRMGLSTDDGVAEVGDKIKVTGDSAASLINAGYAQVDPEDAEAVRAVLHPQAASDDEEEPAKVSQASGTKPRQADSQTSVEGAAAATPSQSGQSST